MRAITRVAVMAAFPLMVFGLVACVSDNDDGLGQAVEPTGDIQGDQPADARGDDGEGHVGEDIGGLAAAGADLFVEKGCSACHGVDGAGTAIAPAMPGHTELQVRRQVRGPIGMMPVFNSEKISSGELDALVTYVTGLEGGHSHGSDSPTADVLLSQHVMAVTALEGDNITEAEHHIEHILGIVAGEHLVLMQHTAGLVNEGEIHEAQHLIETMVADVMAPDEDPGNLHLRLALSSLRIGDSDGTDHHLEHSLGSGDIQDSSEVLEILELIDLKDFEKAEEHLSDLIGVDSIGVEAAGDGHDDGEAPHDDADRHHDADTGGA